MKKQSKFIAFFLCLVVLVGLAPAALAASTQLPEMMVGQTTLFDDAGRTSTYGGMQGNFAVLNYDKNVEYGYGFNMDTLSGCSTPTGACFILGTGLRGDVSASAAGRVMTSLTRVNDLPATETPALFFDNSIIGDAYLPNYSNFAFWGKNLALSAGSGANSADGASWKAGNYAVNAEAKATWGSEAFLEYIDRIKALTGEATLIEPSNANYFTIDAYYGNLNLQSSDENIFSAANPDYDKYKEGRVWVVGKESATGGYDPKGLTIRGSHRFSGKGTIIVTGELVFEAGASITKENADDSLGFIVLNPERIAVELQNNNRVDASIFAIGKINTPTLCNCGYIDFTGDNITLTGSYVARGFDRITENNNIRFFYDYNLESNWPPGFRYLNMPRPKDVGNVD